MSPLIVGFGFVFSYGLKLLINGVQLPEQETNIDFVIKLLSCDGRPLLYRPSFAPFSHRRSCFVCQRELCSHASAQRPAPLKRHRFEGPGQREAAFLVISTCKFNMSVHSLWSEGPNHPSSALGSPHPGEPSATPIRTGACAGRRLRQRRQAAPRR